MTSHHDVAVVVAELRIGFDVSPAIAERAAALLESQAKALSEAERYLRGVLIHFVNEHCEPIPEWKPLPDLLGMLTQFDNASTVARELKARALAAEARLADKEAELSIARQINHDLTDGITGTLQKDKIESLEARLAEAMKVIEQCSDALSHCYQVTEWPADGTTSQDEALTAARIHQCCEGKDRCSGLI